MFETPAELDELQALLDRSFAGMNEHMSGIVKPERRLTAVQVANYFINVKHVSFATVNSKGEPMVAPLDGWFLHGRFVVSTGGGALRLRHLRANPAASLAFVQGDEIGVWAHGSARLLERDSAQAIEFERAATAVYGSSPYSWGDIAVVELQARTMYAYAMDPSKF